MLFSKLLEHFEKGFVRDYRRRFWQVKQPARHEEHGVKVTISVIVLVTKIF